MLDKRNDMPSPRPAARWCPGCDASTLPTSKGCPWCGTTLLDLGPVAPVAPGLQRALEATTLLHLTEPRPS